MGVIQDSKDPIEDKKSGALLEIWQASIARLIFIVILTVFALEWLFLYLLNQFGGTVTPVPQYIPLYIVRPTVINLSAFIIWRTICRNTKSINWLAYSTLATIAIVLSNIMMVHYVFTAAYSVLIIPLFISVVYDSPTITRNTLIGSIALYLFCGYAILTTNPPERLPEDCQYNLILGLVMIPLCYILVRNITRHEKAKADLILEEFVTNKKLREEAEVDELTGVLNYAGFMKHMDQDIPGNYEKGMLHLAVIDIDYFKQVNDIHGHDAGNYVLQELGEILIEAEKEGSLICARYGGEEFAIIFHNMDRIDALKRLQVIHQKFSKSMHGDINRTITFSAGLATYEPGWSAGDLFRKADVALYRAKNNGRNQITMA